MREPDWQTKDGAARLYLGDCREVLAEIATILSASAKWSETAHYTKGRENQ